MITNRKPVKFNGKHMIMYETPMTSMTNLKESSKRRKSENPNRFFPSGASPEGEK